MKDFINEILNSNLYALLFGSGGVLVIVLGIITFFKKKKRNQLLKIQIQL